MAAHPHDTLFRALTDDARRTDRLVRGCLPADVAALLSDAPGRLLPDTFVSPKLRRTQADRLFEMRLRDERRAFVYALLEHKSTVDPDTPVQLLGYMVEIWKRYARGRRILPPVIPLVFYHGAGGWTLPRSVPAMIEAPAPLDELVRSLSYIVHDLGHVAFERLPPDPGVRAVLGLLKYGVVRQLPDDEGRRILVAIEALDPRGDKLLRDQALTYLSSVFELTVEELERLSAAGAPRTRRYLMATLAERWVREGRDEGLVEGEAKGLARGEARGLALGKAETLLRLLGRRFGAVPPDVAARVRRASVAELDAWLDAVLDARALGEVFDPPSMH